MVLRLMIMINFVSKVLGVIESKVCGRVDRGFIDYFVFYVDEDLWKKYVF